MKITFDGLPDDNNRENIHNLSLISDDPVASNSLNDSRIKCKEKEDGFLSCLRIGRLSAPWKLKIAGGLWRRGGSPWPGPFIAAFGFNLEVQVC